MKAPEWWMCTCDRTDAGHGFDHGSLEAARQCTWDEATTEERHEAQELAAAQERNRADRAARPAQWFPL